MLFAVVKLDYLDDSMCCTAVLDIEEILKGCEPQKQKEMAELLFTPYALSKFKDGKIAIISDMDSRDLVKFITVSGAKIETIRQHRASVRVAYMIGNELHYHEDCRTDIKNYRLSDCVMSLDVKDEPKELKPDPKGEPKRKVVMIVGRGMGRKSSILTALAKAWNETFKNHGGLVNELDDIEKQLLETDFEKKVTANFPYEFTRNYTFDFNSFYNAYGVPENLNLDCTKKTYQQSEKEQAIKDGFEAIGSLIDFSKCWNVKINKQANEVIDNAVKAVDKHKKELKRKAKKQQKQHDRAKDAYYVTGHDMEYFDETDGEFKKCPSRRIYRFIKKD